MSLISNSGHDENGGIRGGKAGDQTGTEWYLRTWYSRPWKCVLRHPDPEVRAKIAELGVKAAKNDNVGYDQGERTSYWYQLQKAGYDPSKITTPCEDDCSAGVTANVKAVGYILGIKDLQEVPITSTYYMREELRKAGFMVLTENKYLTSADYLLPGDILLNDELHTATNIEKGKYASETSGTPSTSTETGGRVSVTANLPILKKGMTGNAVGIWQEILCLAGYETTVDKSFGPKTEAQTEAFERSKGITDDPNEVGPAAWKAGLELLSAAKTF